MTSENLVIIGSGAAGARAAESLRKIGWDGRIHLVSREAELPYERPAVSKAMLFGNGRENFGLWSETTAADLAVDFHAGINVEAIDRSARSVLLSGAGSLSFRHLIVATGARPRHLAVAPPSEGVFYLRTMDDAQLLQPCLKAISRLVVVGAGLIGLEIAAGASRQGLSVTVLEATRQILSRAVPPEVSEAVLATQRREGVDVRFGAAIVAVEGSLGDIRVRLENGDTIDCEAVVVAVGAEPSVELAIDAGLSVSGGILVDDKFATSDPQIYAAGDVCSFVHPLFGERMRLESWQNAEEQGRHIARTIAGERKPFGAVPWFWSEQFDKVLHVAGVTHLGAAVERPCSGDDRIFFYLDPLGKLVGLAAFGSSAGIGRTVSIGRRLIAAQATPDPAILVDGGSDLATLLRN